MEILTNASAIQKKLMGLMDTHDHYRWAVAWASTGFNAWHRLLKYKRRIQHIVIGTHFHQTDPEVMRSLKGVRGVRFVTDLSGVFHHKVYLFEKRNGDWSALIGSANFTNGGMSTNGESAIVIRNTDSEDPDWDKGELEGLIEGAWSSAPASLKPEWLSWYTQMWEDKQERLRAQAGRFGRGLRRNKRKNDTAAEDGGRPVGDIPILTLPWLKYLQQVRREHDGDAVDGRLEVLERIRDIFQGHSSFASMDLDDRNRIAGTIPRNSKLVAADNVDWAWFGRMFGAGKFLRTVIREHEAISDALDAIPLVGSVDRKDYDHFMAGFMTLRGTGIGNASRLLAMKRPDVFVCVNTRNARLLKRLVGFHGALDQEAYWDSIIRRIQQAVWWNAPCPANGIARRVWRNRAAMLDAITYHHD